MSGDETTVPDRASDAHFLGDGEWAQGTRDWRDARIRTVVRDAGFTGTGPGPATVIAARPALRAR
ncbi:hypothetical protein [Streptomyces sp. YGL11-2]|uniref:hypothetical protein n=1 Tax=Streptomyces sp. YGL11-2 TaxID=3414028 RepID=UPI003CF0A0C2